MDMLQYVTEESYLDWTSEGIKLRDRVHNTLDYWLYWQRGGGCAAVVVGLIFVRFVTTNFARWSYDAWWSLPEGGISEYPRQYETLWLWFLSALTIVVTYGIMYPVYVRPRRDEALLILLDLVAENDIFWRNLQQMEPGTAERVRNFLGQDELWKRPGFIQHKVAPD